MNNPFAITCMEALIALTLALATALCLRTPLRNLFGARNSYLLWILIPLLPLVCLIGLFAPEATLTILPAHAPILSNQLILSTPHTDAIEIPTLVAIVWIAGVGLHTTLQCLRQLRFVRQLDLVKLRDGIYLANTADINPALVGLIRPKIIVPSNFATRYNNDEQRLILAHENMHRQRGDHLANAACALLLSLFWFHPLLHFCVPRFRFDQELACDAALLLISKNSRKAYANAMLKASVFDITLPAACHWPSHQLLEERIMQLNRKSPNSFTRRSGQAVIAALLTAAACFTWAAQSAPTPTARIYKIVATITSEGGAPVTSTYRVAEGQTFALTGGEKNHWSGSAVLSLAGSNSVKVKLALAHADKSMGNPAVITHFGEVAKVKTSDDAAEFELEFKVSPAQ